MCITNAVLQNWPVNRDNLSKKNIFAFFYAILCNQKLGITIFEKKRPKSIIVSHWSRGSQQVKGKTGFLGR